MKITKLKITLEGKILVDINFSVSSSLALVGQSGSGKSLTLKALLGMLPDGMDLDIDIDCDFELVAGDTLAFVPQNPFTALSPLTKIQKQFFVDDDRIKELFGQVGLDISFLDRFPPELSGGQLQRVVIAMALSSNPKILLLDEPTTALDPDTTLLIMELLKSLQSEFGFKILFVTHDMNSAKSLCEDICVIKDGSVMESGSMSNIVNNPTNVYTKILIESNFSNREFRA